MTATEVLQRQEERMRLMGPMVGRLQFELLGPMIDRVFNIMVRRKMLPPAPEKIRGRNTRIDYVSPVARAQKTQQLFNFTRLMESLVPLANVKPEVFDNIDADGTVRWAAKLLDAPLETLVSTEQLQQMREQKGQQAQQQLDLAKNREMAAMAKDAATAAAVMPEGAMQPPPALGVEPGASGVPGAPI